jgi:NAD(P)-dependent dehydrogenase (short-subunit alcohol dehydrogenase family)
MIGGIVRLAGKVALISGAGGPMGGAVAARFAQEGASLILTDISGNRLEGAAQRIRPLLKEGAKLSHKRANVTVRPEAAEVVSAGVAETGPVDILVNVVGGVKATAVYESFLTMSEERWNATFDLNLKGTFHLVQMIVPGMIERRWGKVVNFSSVMYAGAAGSVDYSAAKAAVASLTRSLALEFAPHVQVNCIAPSSIKTSAFDKVPEEEKQRWENMTPLRRHGEPSEVADACLYLASGESAFVTGAILPVSGGIWPSL